MLQNSFNPYMQGEHTNRKAFPCTGPKSTEMNK